MSSPRTTSSSTNHSTSRPVLPSQLLVSSPSPARPVSTGPSHSSSSSSRSNLQNGPNCQSRPTHSQSPFRYVPALQHQARFFSADNRPSNGDHCHRSSVLQMNTLGRTVPCSPTNKHASVDNTPHNHSRSTLSSHNSRGVHGNSRSYSSEIPSQSQCSTSILERPPIRSSSLVNSSGLLQPRRQVRRLLLRERLKPWIPFFLYALTSLGFVVAITMWKVEVFQALDDLSHWLQAQEYTGYGILFFLIFLTTFPPLPLYSTLTVLAGYTFGAWHGAVVSYFAALFGAFAVFVLSRSYFRTSINRCLSHTASLKRVVRAIEKRPKLLFLIRLAPYPYNVMNALLAGSPTLTLRTYMTCTALSLFKVIIHTSIGASIHSFAEFHTPDDLADGDPNKKADNGDWLSQFSTGVGIFLCVALAVYLSYVARRAVDEELEHDDELLNHDDEDLEDNDEEEADERATFLRRSASPSREMAERATRNGAPPLSAGLQSQFATTGEHTKSTEQPSTLTAMDKFEYCAREEASIGMYSYY